MELIFVDFECGFNVFFILIRFFDWLALMVVVIVGCCFAV